MLVNYKKYLEYVEINTLLGSLPRPPSVLAYLKDRKDEAIPAAILETAVKETVQKQIEVLYTAFYI